MKQYLKNSFFFDFDKPAVQQMAEELAPDSLNLMPKEIAIRLYNGVRDSVKYNPYVFTPDPRTLSASFCALANESYCIPKAVLLGAMARYKGIPARLGLADVKNHLSSEKLIAFLKSDIFVMHGYIELYIDGHWVKATPAFDKELCDKMNVETLEFDGETDSVFQEFNNEGHKHMEYICEHGTFDDVPMDKIIKAVIEAYPHLASEDLFNEFHLNSLRLEV